MGSSNKVEFGTVGKSTSLIINKINYLIINILN